MDIFFHLWEININHEVFKFFFFFALRMSCMGFQPLLKSTDHSSLSWDVLVSGMKVMQKNGRVKEWAEMERKQTCTITKLTVLSIKTIEVELSPYLLPRNDG